MTDYKQQAQDKVNKHAKFIEEYCEKHNLELTIDYSSETIELFSVVKNKNNIKYYAYTVINTEEI